MAISSVNHSLLLFPCLKAIAQWKEIDAYQVHDSSAPLCAITHDSRLVEMGGGFIAIQGFARDGSQFIDDALIKGAKVLFLNSLPAFEALCKTAPTDVSLFLIKPQQQRKMLAKLAATVCGNPAAYLRMLAVTGTNGKTTVSHITQQLLRALSVRCGLIGTLGMHSTHFEQPTLHTTPEAPVLHQFLKTSYQQGDTHVVLEATSVALELDRLHGIGFHAAAFTNLTQDHLDFHSTMAAYQAAKWKLFSANPQSAAAIHIADSTGAVFAQRLWQQLLAEKKHDQLKLITYALSPKSHEEINWGAYAPPHLYCSQLQSTFLTTGNLGWQGRLHWQQQCFSFMFPFAAQYDLENMLASLALLLLDGQDCAKLVDALPTCLPIPGRFEKVPCSLPFLVVVDYAHTPHALLSALQAARQLLKAHKNKLWVLFGCGGNRDVSKRPLMGDIAWNHADCVVVTSDNPRMESPTEIISQMVANIPQPIQADFNTEGLHSDAKAFDKGLFCEPDRSKAIDLVIAKAQPGDVILIAGKGHETYQEIEGKRYPFSDATQVLAAAARHHATRD